MRRYRRKAQTDNRENDKGERTKESDLRKFRSPLGYDSKIQGDELAPTTARLCHARRHHTTTLGFTFLVQPKLSKIDTGRQQRLSAAV